MKTLKETILKHSWQEDMVGPDLVRVDDAIDALRQWLAYEGLVVVPKLPSEDQFRAGAAFRFAVETHGYKDTAGIYEAMIAAAPDALREGE